MFIEATASMGFSRYSKRVEGEIFEVDDADGLAFIDSGFAIKSKKKEMYKPEPPAAESKEPPKRKRPTGLKEKAEAKEKADLENFHQRTVDIFSGYTGEQMIGFEKINREDIPNWPEKTIKAFLKKWDRVVKIKYVVGEGPKKDDKEK